MVVVAEVVTARARRGAAAGLFRVFVQDETFYVSLPRTGCFLGHPKAFD